MEIHMYHRQRKNKQRIRTKFSAFMMLFVFIFVLVCHIGLLNPDLTASVKTSFQDTLKGLFTNSSKQDTALSYSESRPENTTLSVTFLDVGQGNCVLAESDGHYMLIDGGDRSHSSFVVSYLQQAGITALDYVLISHYDADHVSGVIGAVGWVVYCYIRKDLAYDSFYAMFFATVALSLLSELAARVFKQPVTIFVIPGIIPIVPGLGMYRGMAAIIENNYETGMNILITTGMDASAIALGMMLMTSVFRVIKISKDHKRLLQLLHKENKQ